MVYRFTGWLATRWQLNKYLMDRIRGSITKDVKNAVSSLIWIKVVCVGDTASGKTCLIKHFCEKKFNNAYYPTVGVDYGFKIQSIKGTDVRVHLWDLAGGPEYVEIRKELYASSDVVLILMDLTQSSALPRASAWLAELEHFGPKPAPVLALVGSKADVKAQRTISVDQATRWAQDHDMRYYETSCATGIGLETVFSNLLTAVLDQRSK